MTRIFDNIDLRLGEHLQATFEQFERMDVAVGYFNLRGWSAFDALVRAKIAGEKPVVRVLIGMVHGGPEEETLDELQSAVDGQPRPEADATIARDRKLALVEHLRLQLMRGVPTRTDRETLASLRALLDEDAVQIKVFTRRPLHGKTFVFHREDLNTPIIGFVGSSNFTAPGLTHNLELNVDVVDSTGGAKDLADWFEDRWNDPFSRNVTTEILDLIDESWAATTPRPPYEVFLKVCYDLSRDVRDGLAEYSVPGEIRNELLEYQATAVRTLARRIVTRRGTMLGDVVGLGKTITAVAVALMLREEHGYLPLVVCPKNLVPMWQDYFDAYELNGKVISYSMAHAELPALSRYKFVIIDESHTLRNDKRRDYLAVQDYLSRVDCRTLLLTATPYNRRFEDVANQLALFIEPDDDLGIAPVNALRLDPKLADKLDNKITTLEAFRRSEDPDDWKRLMSEHLVRRTRSFIKNNYSLTDEDGKQYLAFADGTKFRFPERTAIPLNHSFGDDDPALLMTSDQTLDTLIGLILPRYKLSDYLDPKASLSDDERDVVENLRRGRGQVAGFVRTTLYKRLSSGGYAFTLSLRRHVARNELFIYAIDQGLALPTGTINEADMLNDDEDVSEYDVAETERLGDGVERRYDALIEANPKNLTWVRSELFGPELREALQHDTDGLIALLDEYGDWKPDRDSKLAALITLVQETHPDEKVLVFTEYKDTANYLASSLLAAGVTQVDAATGDDEDPTALARRFSPASNRLPGRDEPVEDELRVLVSTDVLSEGQNLQDAHIVVNYDLPWAIVRLIQRAGRVDRIGQKAPDVLIYSFFHSSLNAVLSLRQRISERLSVNAEAFGSDEAFFGSEDEVKTITDLYNGTVDDLEEIEDIDAASLAYQYWHHAEDQTPEIAERVKRFPDLIDSTRAKRITETDTGVVAYVRTEAGIDGFGRINPEGETRLLTGLEALRAFEATPDEQGFEHLDNHDELVTALVRGPLATPAAAAGRLRGVRRQIWRRLGETLIDHGLEAQTALELLYQHPLTAEADRRLRNAVRNGVEDDELAARVVALHRDERLVIESRSGNDPIRIVSTMGIK